MRKKHRIRPHLLPLLSEGEGKVEGEHFCYIEVQKPQSSKRYSNSKYIRIMEATATTYKARTREEIMAWFQQAKERKEAFQRRVDEEWKARQLSKKAAADSGYYDIEWV